ncbi:unnamed protein product [Schistosoma margrebowiei]|uniref:Uncharacterized protein n=1 Tax=Schistosoma margrebowiei TaxID=48269 RepID=A0A3P8B438_9TREM|nr:unnamed protein product [Schistosoma margrebowiei]
MLTVRRCDSSKVFPSDNQHDSDAAFPQGVGLEKVDSKNAQLASSHGYPSPEVRFQLVRS